MPATGDARRADAGDADIPDSQPVDGVGAIGRHVGSATVDDVEVVADDEIVAGGITASAGNHHDERQDEEEDEEEEEDVEYEDEDEHENEEEEVVVQAVGTQGGLEELEELEELEKLGVKDVQVVEEEMEEEEEQAEESEDDEEATRGSTHGRPKISHILFTTSRSGSDSSDDWKPAEPKTLSYW